MSEVKHDADANAKWDDCVDLTVRRFVNSTVAVTFGGFLLFPFFMIPSPAFRRAAMAFGAGIGIGSAYTECSQKFDTRSASHSQTPTSQGAQD